MLKSKLKLKLLLAVGIISTLSACGQPEPLRTVSDFCLISERITVEVSPDKNQVDVGNLWDSDLTVGQVLTHNAKIDRVCLTK